jgi:aspartyl-tRNA synthetase
MTSQSNDTNGAGFLDSSSLENGAVEKGERLDEYTIDGRVHGVHASTSNATITVLLRRNGQFINALVEPDSTNITSLDEVRSLTVESLVRVSGSTILEHRPGKDRAVSGVVTVRVSKLVVLSKAKAGLEQCLRMHGAPGEELPPTESRATSIDERLDNRLLDARVAATAAIFKLFSGIHELAVEYLAALGFYHTPTPAFISYEYPGEEEDHFHVQYFDKTAWLAPTGEVHLGMALAADLERVYDIHTVFRREKDVDGRHLTEVCDSFTCSPPPESPTVTLSYGLLRYGCR